MKKLLLLMFPAICCLGNISAQGPIITSWKINTTGAHITKGSATIITDVEALFYDSTDIYIKTSGVPGYYDFSTNTNVNEASDLQAVFRITRTPQKNTGTPISALGGGQYGIARDGTLIFNGEDARTYQNQNVWHQLAYYFEVKDLDNTWGHSSPTNDYHHHTLDLALQDTTKDMVHSPIQGYAFDGYPIYGPFAYKDPNDAKSKIVRVKSGYQKRNITDRTTLPDGTKLSATQYGPGFTGMTPLGCYREDYTYVAGSGMLDDHNGRFCVTPEYPNGTYAYFAILDSQMQPAYPFVFGQSLYGVPTQGNMGPGGGKFTVPANALKYNPKSGIDEKTDTRIISLYPNPSSNNVRLSLPGNNEKWQLEITDIAGRVVFRQQGLGNELDINISSLNPGVYFIKANSLSDYTSFTGKMLKD